MKKIIAVEMVLLLTVFACNNNPHEAAQADRPVAEMQPLAAPEQTALDTVTESFTGIMNGDTILFEHSHYLKYRLTENGKVRLGEVNTERGFEKDRNATVYVLDPDKPEGEQKYFVRFTGGKIVMLDSQRKIIAGSENIKNYSAPVK